MKQTAVEWFKDVIESFGNKHELQMSWDTFNEVFEQAKEMEKEQIVNAFEIGYDNGACVQEGNAIYHGSNYYKETFKSE